jgi:hypothetical protein
VPDVAATLFAPVALNPDCAAVWRMAEGTVDPDIAVAVPAVVAGNPNPALVGWGRDDFDGARRRWANADDNLRVGSADREEEGTGCGEELFLHLSFSF